MVINLNIFEANDKLSKDVRRIIAQHLLQFGETIETPTLLRRFLGRPISDQALRRELRRIGATTQATSDSVASKIATASSISAADTTNGGMNRTVD